ncbi:MAG: AsmA-like C-terminal domain-containing protein [Tepidisphaeraceae bacterium]
MIGGAARMNAILEIQGSWDPNAPPDQSKTTSTRRGRGDVSISGEKMLRVPMMVGVTQLVSLQLPFTTGFNQADASYVIEGPRVTMSDITLRSREMQIRGAGWLDFDSKDVNLNFYTEPGSATKLPVIGELLKAARRELLQIKVRGTLKQPEVKAGTLPTFTATVDEILDDAKK